MSSTDMDFLLPVNPARLQNKRMRLVPVDNELSKYAELVVNGTKDSVGIYKYLPYGPFSTAADYLTWYRGRVGASNRETLFAILLQEGKVQKGKAGGSTNENEEFEVEDGTFAGIIGLLDALPQHSSVEMGHVMILSRFQRTFVTTNAIALLLKHLLDPLPHDLNLRRVMWQANASNQPSIAAAQRMGFRLEGIARWQRVLPASKVGVEAQNMPRKNYDGQEMGPGRHSAMLSLCWDDWIEGAREKVEALESR